MSRLFGFFSSNKLQRVVHPDFSLSANCSTKFQAVFAKLQIAGVESLTFISSCKLQEEKHTYFCCAANCSIKFSTFYGFEVIEYLGVATGRIELPLPNHRSGVAFGGFPTIPIIYGSDDSRPVCYPTRVATHGDATGRLFYVQGWKGARQPEEKIETKTIV